MSTIQNTTIVKNKNKIKSEPAAVVRPVDALERIVPAERQNVAAAEFVAVAGAFAENK